MRTICESVNQRVCIFRSVSLCMCVSVEQARTVATSLRLLSVFFGLLSLFCCVFFLKKNPSGADVAVTKQYYARECWLYTNPHSVLQRVCVCVCAWYFSVLFRVFFHFFFFFSLLSRRVSCPFELVSNFSLRSSLERIASVFSVHHSVSFSFLNTVNHRNLSSFFFFFFWNTVRCSFFLGFDLINFLPGTFQFDLICNSFVFANLISNSITSKTIVQLCYPVDILCLCFESCLCFHLPSLTVFQCNWRSENAATHIVQLKRKIKMCVSYDNNRSEMQTVKLQV